MPTRRKPTLIRFGDALREVRKSQALSQERLAFEAEINPKYMGALERGEENVSILTLLKISAVLKTKPSLLLDKAGH